VVERERCPDCGWALPRIACPQLAVTASHCGSNDRRFLMITPEIIVLIVAGILGLLLIRRMGGRGPFTTRLCKTCREIIDDRTKVCPHCHAETAYGRKQAGKA
jgi:hypothetical protein